MYEKAGGKKTYFVKKKITVYVTTLQSKKGVLHSEERREYSHTMMSKRKTKLNVTICFYFMAQYYDQFAVVISNNQK